MIEANEASASLAMAWPLRNSLISRWRTLTIERFDRFNVVVIRGSEAIGKGVKSTLGSYLIYFSSL